MGETNPEPHLWKGRLSFEVYLIKCGDEGRLEGKLEDKYNELIKDRCTEECDMVQSKGTRPAVDSSSGDTDVDISVLTIDETVETAGDGDVTGVKPSRVVLWWLSPRHRAWLQVAGVVPRKHIRRHALHRHRIPAGLRRETVSCSKNNLSPQSPSKGAPASRVPIRHSARHSPLKARKQLKL